MTEIYFYYEILKMKRRYFAYEINDKLFYAVTTIHVCEYQSLKLRDLLKGSEPSCENISQW